jgi:hypothetical protein
MVVTFPIGPGDDPGAARLSHEKALSRPVAMGGDPYISSFGEVIILQSARNRSTSGTKVRWCWNTPPWPELG